MDKNDEERVGIRRANLRRLIDLHFGGNRSAFARVYRPDSPSASQISDMLRKGSKKSFGEKVARRVERAVGLQLGQLDMPDSPLEMEKARTTDGELLLDVSGLTRDEKAEVEAAARAALQGIAVRRRRKPRRA